MGSRASQPRSSDVQRQAAAATSHPFSRSPENRPILEREAATSGLPQSGGKIAGNRPRSKNGRCDLLRTRRNPNVLRDSAGPPGVGGGGGAAPRPPLVWALFFPGRYVRLKLSSAGISPTVDVDRCSKQRNTPHVLAQSEYDAGCTPICGYRARKSVVGWKGSSGTIDCWATLHDCGEDCLGRHAG